MQKTNNIIWLPVIIVCMAITFILLAIIGLLFHVTIALAVIISVLVSVSITAYIMSLSLKIIFTKLIKKKERLDGRKVRYAGTNNDSTIFEDTPLPTKTIVLNPEYKR